jgi:thiamine-phosphate pyrophosphorylase
MAALDGTPGRVIINDNVEAACAIGAHGLHIGQGDMPVADARARIGAGPILGVSVETLDAARAIDPALVDYVGAGPVFATRTKADHKPPVGWDGLAAIVAAAPVPAVAIGGLKAVHMAQVRAAGAAGAAVVSAICGQPDPEAAARELARKFAKAPA